MNSPPSPFDEREAEDRFWVPEPWDDNLPKGRGFVSDFVFATRGMETPTSFCCWSALYLISSVLRRDAWIKWFPKPLYANLFVVMVAPPRICGKSTVSNLGGKILREFPEEITNAVIKLVKSPHIIQNKATPEALIKALEPTAVNVPVGTFMRRIDQGSQVAIIVPELETFLGKQKYNEGLIGLLMDIYDCHDRWEYHSVVHGIQQMRDMFVTFLGATTPEGLELSINDAAFGQGFMSRVIIVYEARSTRCYPKPRPVPGAPSNQELERRLAWVATNANGEYDLSPEALALYETWYKDFRKKLEGGGEKIKLLYRMDNMLLKLSMLIRAQRYEVGNVIEVQDFEDAKRILDATYKMAWSALDSVGATQYHRYLRAAENVIREKGQVSRRDVLMAVRWEDSKQCTQAMSQLYQEGKIRITSNGSDRNQASSNGAEVYTWIAPA